MLDSVVRKDESIVFKSVPSYIWQEQSQGLLKAKGGNPPSSVRIPGLITEIYTAIFEQVGRTIGTMRFKLCPGAFNTEGCGVQKVQA